ncbi:hypothetical protein CO033_02340 [Candidatus Nomurabacteria bacterium CG_4_9_14_0_2_um_filter_32_10]|uniref:Uncharacterized protein n=2 Tax=Candidatus Nomuraibacteriota TaxID=1752729 RepID=A0A2J0N5F7_9BACT|nr:MAG: hypothetical protein CO033_02340 [Candidatus Nomurabacteria bacterium CG_4_9_14_0_2_um_filter_32_10]
MKNNKGFIGLGIILVIIVVLAVGGGAYYLGTKNNSTTQNPIVDPILEVKNLVADVYPLYPNLSWNTEVAITTEIFDLKLSGYKINSKNILDTQYYKLGMSFNKYYEDKLTVKGWVRDNKFDADGAGSSSWVYTKGKDFILLSYKSIAINQIPNEPLSCPCNMTFSIFSGQINDSTQELDVSLMTEDQILKKQLSWKNSVIINGKKYPFPNDWVSDTIIINGIKINITYPAPKQTYTPNNYIALSFPASLVSSLKTTKCIGDSEVSSCMVGSDFNIGRYFDVMWYFH